MLDDIKPEAEVDENVLMLIKQWKETSEELDNLTEEENEDNDTQRNDTQKKIDLIKIDTEGHEFNVIKGMGNKLIQKTKLILSTLAYNYQDIQLLKEIDFNLFYINI